MQTRNISQTSVMGLNRPPTQNPTDKNLSRNLKIATSPQAAEEGPETKT